MLDSAALRLLLLDLLSQQQRHGYELIRAIESLTRGVYAPSPGVVYPSLTQLVQDGLLKELDTGDQRRPFAVTAKGKATLRRSAEEVTAIAQRLQALAEVRERVEAAPVRRAMQGLKSALFDRLSDGAARDTVLAIAEIIDHATRQIERLP